MIDETGWTREYVAWNTNYPWLLTWLKYREKHPSPSRNTFEISSMLKSFFQVKDGVEREEVIQPEDSSVFQSVEHLSVEQAQQKLKGLGIDPAALNALYSKKE